MEPFKCGVPTDQRTLMYRRHSVSLEK